MKRKIKISIDKNGEIQMEVLGAVGSNCEEFTAPFEAALGMVSKKELKSSYYNSAESELNLERNLYE